MSRIQQSSIRSFFQPRRQPEYAAPPSTAPLENGNVATQSTSKPPVSPSADHLNATSTEPVKIPITLPPSGIPILPSPPSLPSGATIVPLVQEHVPALRRINSLLLPVPYPDSFYAKVLDPLASGLFSRAILWQDSDADTPKVIGGLICRLEPNPFLDTQGQLIPHPFPPSHLQKPSNVPLNTPYHAIYIQSLALLSPYRSLGLAAAALEHIIASATILPAAGSSIDARTIYAHVWTENEEGLKWYEARGFAREGAEPMKEYYFKLRPGTAWVVRRHIGPTAAAAAANLTTTATTTTTTAPALPPTTSTSSSESVLAAAVNLPLLAPKPPPPPPPPPRAPTPGTSGGGGPPRRPSAPPSANASSTSLSFQNARPESEWNDLPADMVSTGKVGSGSNNTNSPRLLSPDAAAAAANGSGGRAGAGAGTPVSGASSRSSSTGRKKRDRTYPTAAFGA
ncbi:hypothetical protein CHGG_06198 [Chaetomium globosum CBS 148.51]|uniref:N-acetyltransferase domain-containing protein n=1 Tax=Chaetomium globosum (strain ATCC 6205 / CBS 148.51 / DSM 1962 / NBRC 6347 / NRRL 1970) TaxID=306901 RepID=Q2H567_CHAGB|nr:uncharacterized protein CHGG_06198 [Chaetomium globosum CBS 148.51]EAQ89579.1 hypothetical protein CHGG_06198 [Chaetomium globosum CBS 148.51]